MHLRKYHNILKFNTKCTLQLHW